MTEAELQAETIETLRQLTLQIMLISAGVFGIVGGFVSSSEKRFRYRWWLLVALLLFSGSALVGYALHGLLITQLHAGSFDPFSIVLTYLGASQIGALVGGGVCFTIFVFSNTK